MKKFFLGLISLLTLLIAVATGYGVRNLIQIAQSTSNAESYLRRTLNETEAIRQEVRSLSSQLHEIHKNSKAVTEKSSEINSEIAKLSGKASAMLDKVASLEAKAESYKALPPLPELLPPIPESLLDDVNRFQAEKAKREGKNRTDPPESDPWGDLFKSIPDEPPPPPEEPETPKTTGKNRLSV